MDEPGDIEVLERRVSLLRDLMENLEAQRERRRRGVPPRPARHRSPERELRLVGDDRESTPAVARRPDFGRSSLPGRPNAAISLRSDPEVPAVLPQGDGSTAGGDEPEPRRFEQIRRERDDLAVQVQRLQTVERELLERRAREKDRKTQIRRLRKELRRAREGRFDDLLGRLQTRLAEAEGLHNSLLRRVEDGRQPPDVVARARRAPMSGSRVDAGKKLWVRGHEIVVATTPVDDDTFYSFAVLHADLGRGVGLKGFHATAPTLPGCEMECISAVLQYLEEGGGEIHDRRKASARSLATIRGRVIDIFCDLVGPGTFQAFPFLYDAEGRRRIMLRFHREEAITGDTVEEARVRCVRRLEEHFEGEGGPAPSPTPGS